MGDVAKLDSVVAPVQIDGYVTRTTGTLEESISGVFNGSVATSDKGRRRARGPGGPWRRG